MASKSFLLGTVSSVAAATAAYPADLPIKMPVAPVVVPAASWAGVYIGIHAGAAWQQATNSTDQYTGYGFGGLSHTTNNTGFIGGGQIGFNWQSGNIVYGVEADWSKLSGKGSYSGYTFAENSIDWLGTARLRMGLAVGNGLAYVTGGVAYGKVNNTVGYCCTTSWSESKTRVGFAVGAGVEQLLSQNWTVRLEGMFVDLGRSEVNTNNFGGTDKRAKFSNQAVIVRGALNYKF